MSTVAPATGFPNASMTRIDIGGSWLPSPPKCRQDSSTNSSWFGRVKLRCVVESRSASKAKDVGSVMPKPLKRRVGDDHDIRARQQMRNLENPALARAGDVISVSQSHDDPAR